MSIGKRNIIKINKIMWIINILKNLFKKSEVKNAEEPEYNWARVDIPEKMEQATHFNEIVMSAAPVEWKPLDLSKLPKYNVRNQDGSGACVMATRALIWAIEYLKRTKQWVDFSFAWPYSQRADKSQLGARATDALDVGMVPDNLMPSDGKDEAYMNNPPNFQWLGDIAKKFAIDGVPIIDPVGDIDVIASIIQKTGKAVQLFFLFGSNEWDKMPHILGSKTPYAHSVTAIPSSNQDEMTFGIYNGKKAIVIQDSWGKDLNTINGLRIITEDFFKTRNFYAQHFMRFKFSEVADKPKYDGTIVSLQDCLKYDGEFPTNIDSTGVFGPTTKGAVIAFQKKYGIDPIGIVGPITIKKLKELFN